MSNAAWSTLSNQAIAAAGVVYFLALIAHLVEWSALRTVPVGRAASKVTVPAGVVESSDESSRDGRDHRRGEDLPDRDVRPPRPAAHRHRRRRAPRGPGRPRHGRGPEPGALGQHVRVHDHRLVRGRRGLPAAAQALRPGLDGPDHHRLRARAADGRRALALRPGRAAHRGAAVVLAGDPRDVGDHRHRRVHPGRDHLRALPGQGALPGARRGSPTAATSRGCPRWPPSTASPTGSTPSASRCGPSRC